MTDMNADTKPEVVEPDRPTSPETVTDDPAAMKAEIERLRAENEALSSAGEPHTFWRNFGAGVFILLGVVLLALAISAVWLNRTVMDENRWVDTMAPLAQNAAIQDYVAARTTQAIFENVNVESYVKQALAPLPPQATLFLAAPITGAIQNFVREAATKVVRSQQFYTVWVKMNRVMHQAFIVAITDKSTGAVQKQGGTITLDVGILVDQIKQALVDNGMGFASSINIPISKQQIVLYDSPAIAQLGSAIQLMNTMAYLLPLLALVLLGGGVALAANRQKAVLWMGIGIAAFTIIPVQAIYLGQSAFAKAALELGQMPNAAAQAAYSIVFRNLIRADQLFTVIGLIFVVGALVAGPSRWATSLRSGFQHGLSNIGPDWDFGTAGEWVFYHQAGMRTTGIIAAVAVLLLWPQKSIAAVVWLVVAVIVWVALVAFFGRKRPEPALTEATEAATPVT